MPDPPARVRTAGEIKNQPYHSTPGTKQGDVMLIVILSGKGYYEGPAGHIEVSAGMVGIISSNPPGILYADHTDPYHKAYCRFGGEYARRIAEDIVSTKGHRFFSDPGAHELGERIRFMGYIHRAELPTVLTSDGVQLLDALVGLHRGPGRSGGRLTGSDIRAYLADRISHATDLEAMARDLSVSRSTLCRTARADTGVTVQHLHQELKLEWAKRLLQSRRFSVADVAYRVGYTDPYYFSRVFKKATGNSPRTWRRTTLTGAGGEAAEADPRQS